MSLNKQAIRDAIKNLVDAKMKLAMNRDDSVNATLHDEVLMWTDRVDDLIDTHVCGVTFTAVEAEALMDWFNDAGTPGELVVEFLPKGAVGDDDETNSVSPAGLYIRDLECPEEGVIYLGDGDDQSVPVKYATENLVSFCASTAKQPMIAIEAPDTPERREIVAQVLDTTVMMLRAGATVESGGLTAGGDIYQGLWVNCSIKLRGLNPKPKKEDDDAHQS